LPKWKNIAIKRIRIKFDKKKINDEIVKKIILKIILNKTNSNEKYDDQI
jgi:hypothetical protein